MDGTLFFSKHNVKKIWIDLDNSPHVLFFNPIIKELKKRGYKIILTVRDCAQTRELADLFNLEYKQIGRHYGKNKIMKMIGLLVRSLQMIPILLTEKPHLAFSHGSRSQLLIAKILGIPTVVTFDYEYIQGLQYIRPALAIVPELISEKVVEKFAKSISKYSGIKEDVYVPGFVADSTILNSIGIKNGEMVVTIRPPATNAHYHDPKSEELFEAAINNLGQKENIRIVLLPRTDKQGVEIRKMWPEYFNNGKLIIPDRVVNGLNLIWHSDFVVSGGGTMIREAAALNVPAYSIFSGKTGAVDQYLADSGRLILLKNVEDVRSKIVLARRHRPAQPDPKNGTALYRIIDEVVSILINK